MDDHALTRDGIRSLLSQELDLQIVGEAADGRSAEELADALLPDIVLMDISMRDLNGIEATRRIHARHPEVRLIGLSMHSRDRYVLGMLEAGASGYVHKVSPYEELRNAISRVRQGWVYISPDIADAVVHGAQLPSNDCTSARLGSREREVVQLLAEGQSSGEIARRLGISWNTVESHRRNIMRKLNLHNVASLTRYAIREGITSLED